MEYNSKFLVRIQCMTYNHESYIEDAMAGFVMQNTSFPFVAVIIDDASTDKTGETILRFMDGFFSMDDPVVSRVEEKDYGRLVFAQHKTNKNCFFAVILLKDNHYSRKKSKSAYYQEWSRTRYIAPCEGDDFWTDPKKLQKQVCFLDDNPQYSICSHNFTRFYLDSFSFENRTYYSGLFSDPDSPDRIEYCLDNYFDRWWTQPLTCVYRNGDYLKRIPYSSYRYFKDDIFYYYILKEGKGMLLGDSMGVYRVHSGGVWSGASRIQHSQVAVLNAFDTYYVEGDARAFKRIDREELLLLKMLFNQHSYRDVFIQLCSFRKKAPKNHFRFVSRDFKNFVFDKVKRKMPKIFSFL